LELKKSFMTHRFSNKSRAFTLFETIQTLILISILISILGSTFFYLYQYHNNLTKKLSIQGSLDQLEYLLLKDYANDRYMEFTGDRIIFGADSTTYQLGSQVIRNQGVRVDTFEILGTAEENAGALSVRFIKDDESLGILLKQEKTFEMEGESPL